MNSYYPKMVIFEIKVIPLFKLKTHKELKY